MRRAAEEVWPAAVPLVRHHSFDAARTPGSAGVASGRDATDPLHRIEYLARGDAVFDPHTDSLVNGVVNPGSLYNILKKHCRGLPDTERSFWYMANESVVGTMTEQARYFQNLRRPGAPPEKEGCRRLHVNAYGLNPHPGIYNDFWGITC